MEKIYMEKKDFEVGVVVALSGSILKRLSSVQVIDRFCRLEELPDEERLFVCAGVRKGAVQLAEITSREREQRLFIEPAWRGYQSGYGSLRIGRWCVGKQYVNGAVFVGDPAELCSAALSPQSAGRYRLITEEGMKVVRAFLEPRLKDGQAFYPWKRADAVPHGTSKHWKTAA